MRRRFRDLLRRIARYGTRHAWAVLAPLTAGGIVYMVLWFPEWLINGYNKHGDLKGSEYVRAVDDSRKTAVQVLGALALLGTLYFTWRRNRATEETLAATQKSLELTRESQITERFAKAIEMLGACDNGGKRSLEVRFGGIYALERIAKDSERDHWPVMEILTAYVRQNSPWAGPQDADDKLDVDAHEALPILDRDIQAILTVLGRRETRYEDGKALILNLSGSDLHRADLRRANLARADLSECNLQGSLLHEANFRQATLRRSRLDFSMMSGIDLTQANLQQARLRGVHCDKALMKEANFWGARLDLAYMMGAELNGATFWEASLIEADLSYAKLFGTTFLDANMTGCKLNGADLREVDSLSEAQLKLAVLDSSTKLQAEPGSFRPRGPIPT